MSSESFLPISDDVCRPRKCFYALFSKPPSKKQLGFSGQLTWATAPHRPNGANLEVCWCCFSTLASNRHTGRPGPSLKYLSKSEFTPPPKGGGAGFGQLRVCWAGSFCPQTAHTAFTERVWVLLVLLPTPQTGHKSPHRAEFGFCLLTGTSQTGSPPSPAISCKILGRRKIIPSSPLKNHSANFATPCKRFSNLLKKSPILCLCGANFALPYLFIRS